MKIQPLGVAIADEVQPVRHQAALGKEVEHAQGEARIDQHLDPVSGGTRCHAAACKS